MAYVYEHLSETTKIFDKEWLESPITTEVDLLINNVGDFVTQ